jgi:hypothetical protein
MYLTPRTLIVSHSANHPYNHHSRRKAKNVGNSNQEEVPSPRWGWLADATPSFTNRGDAGHNSSAMNKVTRAAASFSVLPTREPDGEGESGRDLDRGSKSCQSKRSQKRDPIGYEGGSGMGQIPPRSTFGHGPLTETRWAARRSAFQPHTLVSTLSRRVDILRMDVPMVEHPLKALASYR